MIISTILSVILFSAAIVLLLGLTPESITNDLMRLISPKQSLRDKSLIAHNKKKLRRISVELSYIKHALTATGKGRQFTVICSLSLLLCIGGILFAVFINNLFLAPILGAAFSVTPFLYAKKNISAYEKHIRMEMETALSIITTSYIRTEDIVESVEENISYIKPPVCNILKTFIVDATVITSDLKSAITNLKSKVENDIWKEWCDTLIACQDDRSLKDTLLPIISKLTDVRVVNNELQTLLYEPRKEYWTMVALLVGNVPLIYLLNEDWFSTLVNTTAGKIVLALCGVVVFITAYFMLKFTRPIEYKR